MDCSLYIHNARVPLRRRSGFRYSLLERPFRNVDVNYLIGYNYSILTLKHNFMHHLGFLMDYSLSILRFYEILGPFYVCTLLGDQSLNIMRITVYNFKQSNVWDYSLKGHIL